MSMAVKAHHGSLQGARPLSIAFMSGSGCPVVGAVVSQQDLMVLSAQRT